MSRLPCPPDAARTDPGPKRPEGAIPQRDARGRFRAGNRCGHGNPHARQVAAMRRAFANAVSEEDLAEIAQAQVQKAKDGDTLAARFVAEYVMGKPVPVTDPDRVDLDELRQFQEEAALNKVVEECARGAPAALLCPLVQVLRDHVLPEWLERFVVHMTQLFQAARSWAADGPRAGQEAETILTELLAAVAARLGTDGQAAPTAAAPSPDGDNGGQTPPPASSSPRPSQAPAVSPTSPPRPSSQGQPRGATEPMAQADGQRAATMHQAPADYPPPPERHRHPTDLSAPRSDLPPSSQ